MRNFFILLVLLAFYSCEKVAEAYLGLPMQAKNINAEFEDGLNVFGVFKSGPRRDSLTNLSNLFEVHQMVEIHDTMFIVNDAEIIINRIHPEPVLEFYPDTIENGEYHAEGIDPQPGEIYSYSCSAAGFMVLTQTIIPNTPEIFQNNIDRDGSNISFSIKEDTTAFMYDIYALGASNGNFLRVNAALNGNTPVDIDSKTNSEIQLYIFAYDKNFEKYNSTANIFFKPNAFRPSFTTVEGGYGCVYSVCSNLYLIN